MKKSQIGDKTPKFALKLQSKNVSGGWSEEYRELSNEGFDDKILIQLHKVHGNRWKKISSHFPHRDDSFIKNHFYSLLRKSLRKLNAYIKLNFELSKVYRPLKLNFVFKLTNLAEMERNNFSTKNYYQSFYLSILEFLYNFLTLIDREEGQNLGNKNRTLSFDEEKRQGDFVLKMLESINQIEQLFMDFNLNKKGKSRKKCSKKLQLKKEQIKQAQTKKIKGQDFEIYSIQELSPQNGNSTSTPWSIIDEEAELMSFSSDESRVVRQFDMIVGENLFDPILFK